MSKSIQGFICNICGKIIPNKDRYIHQSICNPKKNNISKYNNSSKTNKEQKNKDFTKTFEELNNLNNSKVITYNFIFDVRKNDNNSNQNIQNSEIINRINNHTFTNNTRTVPNMVTNEELLDNEILLNARNIESNYNNPEIFNENEYLTQYNGSINYNISNNNTIKNHPVDKTIVEKLMVNEIKDTKKMDTAKCAICLETYKKGDKYIPLPCFHIFHSECIHKWMNIGNKCPKCNLELTPNNVYNSKV